MTLRVCIYGAGAIGGYLAAKLASTGAKISLVARGAHLQAIRDNGLTVVEAGHAQMIAITATDTPGDLGPQNYVFVTLKAHSIPGAVAAMQPLLGPHTALVFAVNGVPWWYFHGLAGRHENHWLETVDPDGAIWRGIGPKRAIGCVVYPAAELREPGVILHRSANRFSLGEPTGARSERVTILAALLSDAGLKAPIRARIRDEIWIKLWGNASFNPLSALTGATLAQIAGDPDTRRIVSRIMSEIQLVGEAHGARFAVSIDKRIAGAAALGEHKTSMLQDLELRRPLEIDALVGAVQELAVLAGVSTPNLDMILALIKQRARLKHFAPEMSL